MARTRLVTRLWLATTAAVAAATACAGRGAGQAPQAMNWAPVTVPVTAGGTQRADISTVLALRDGRWLLAGAEVRPPATRGGSSGVGSAARTPAFWVATDASKFTATERIGVSQDAPLSSVFSAAVRPDGTTVALANHPSPLHGTPRPIVWRWTASAGATWREVPTTREQFGGPDVIAVSAISAAPDGRFLVAGTWDHGTQQVAAVWSSADGTTWVRHDADPGLAGRPGEAVFGRAIAAGPGAVVMGGTSVRPQPLDPGHTEGAIWYSTDGRSWTRTAATSANALSRRGATDVSTVSAGPSGFVAAGWSVRQGRRELVVWTSRDARTWRPQMVAHVSEGDTLPADPVLTAGPRGLVLAAITGAGSWLMFSSPDGRAWTAWRAPPAITDRSIGRVEHLGVAVDESRAMVVAEGTGGSQVWRTDLPG